DLPVCWRDADSGCRAIDKRNQRQVLDYPPRRGGQTQAQIVGSDHRAKPGNRGYDQVYRE
ncbi:MAG: hypothetical protein ACUVT8_03165, partial [Armatimonadota bacterium]